MRYVLSDRVRLAAKTFPTPLYQLAIRSGLPPGDAYSAIRGIKAVRPDDARYLNLAKLLGVPASEAFESQPIGGEVTK